MNQDQGSGATRRELIKTAAAATVATVAGAGVAKSSAFALASPRVLGANERINVGFVGVGGQGMTHVRLLKENAEENNTSR